MIAKFRPLRSICDGFRNKCPLPVFKVKGHQVTYLHIFYYITHIRAVILKCRPFRSINNGYRDKRPLPVLKVIGWPTYSFSLYNPYFSKWSQNIVPFALLAMVSEIITHFLFSRSYLHCGRYSSAKINNKLWVNYPTGICMYYILLLNTTFCYCRNWLFVADLLAT